MQHFSWYDLVPGYHELTQWLIQVGVLEEGHSAQHLVSATLIFFALVLVSFLVKRRYSDPEKNLVPSRRFGLIPVIELIVEKLRDLIRETVGTHDAERHVPILVATFLFIFASNLMGVIPGFPPPTTTIATNLAMALVIFLYYNFSGFRAHGIGYLKQFMGPVVWLAWMMIPIEIISHLVRPLSLSIRLAGNMTGDHTVLSLFTDMTYVGIPVIFLGLGVFVSFIQAFVFTLLSLIYVAMAVSHDH